MANLQPSDSRSPDAWSIKLTFSITINFYLRNVDISKIKEVLVLKYIFSVTKICVRTYVPNIKFIA